MEVDQSSDVLNKAQHFYSILTNCVESRVERDLSLGNYPLRFYFLIQENALYLSFK